MKSIGFYATAGVIIGGAIVAIPSTFIYPYRFIYATATDGYVKGSGQAIPALYGGAFGVLVGCAAVLMLAGVAGLLIELAARLWGQVPDVKEGSSHEESGTLLRVREAGRNGRLR